MGVAVHGVQADDLLERLYRHAVALLQHQGHTLAGPDVEVVGIQLQGLLVRHHRLLRTVVGHQGKASGPPQQPVGRIEGDRPRQRLGGLGEPSHGIQRIALDAPELRLLREQLGAGDGLVQGFLMPLLRV